MTYTKAVHIKIVTELSTEAFPAAFIVVPVYHVLIIFLIGQPLVLWPDHGVVNVEQTCLNRWQLIRKFHQQFWKRWSCEYLSTLHERGKWDGSGINIFIGDVVIIKNPDAPPTVWKIERVIDVHPGKDGTVRVVTLKTSNGLV